MLLSGQEHVDDAAPDDEFSPPLHHVDAVVRRIGQTAYEVVELDLVALAQRERLEVGQFLDLRLQHRTDRRDYYVQLCRRPLGSAGMGRPAKHRQWATDGVQPRGQPLVRQGLLAS